jgi:hypothetical protein
MLTLGRERRCAMLKQLFDFFSSIENYVEPDAEGIGSRFHRFIIILSGLCGVVLAVVFTFVIFALRPEGQPFPPKYLLAPAIFFMFGVISGVSVSCTFAPSSFLNGPAGRKWMKLIGTESVVVARLVCGCFTILFLGFIGVMIWAVWSDIQRGLM